MPQPRKYESNAARQAAYRARKKKREGASTNDIITRRVMAADQKARA